MPLARLQALHGDDTGLWLHNLAQGIDAEEVKHRMLPKSLSCGKTFRGPNMLADLETGGWGGGFEIQFQFQVAGRVSGYLPPPGLRLFYSSWNNNIINCNRMTFAHPSTCLFVSM